MSKIVLLILFSKFLYVSSKNTTSSPKLNYTSDDFSPNGTLDDDYPNSNCSNEYCLDDDDYLDLIIDHILPTPFEWILIFMHTVTFVVGLVGNALVCIAVYKNRGMRNVTNYFIVNLAVADFMVILFCLPPTVVWDVTETWFMGTLLCKIVLYFQMLQERISCFMVNTAAKIYRMNIENKMYDKNIIFSPMDLFTTTTLAYLGTTDDRVRRQLNTFLGIKTLEKFLELNPGYFLPTQNQKVEIKARKNLINLINNLWRDNGDIHHQYYYDSVNERLGDLLRNSSKTRTASIRSGKAIFVDAKFTLENTFIQNAKFYYDFDVKRMNFMKMPKQSTEKINSFVKDQTNDRILDFFDKPVETKTESVMSSSLTLVASWKKLFQPKDSYETAFHTRDGECDDCDDMDICVMMNQGKIPYYSDSSVSAISLPTANLQIRMFYVVPQNNRTLSEIVSRPNKNFVKNIINKVAPKLIVYHVPKMTFRGEINQLDIFHSSGLNNVSLDGIANHLTLSIFKQKILLEINEEGIGGCPLRRSKKMPVMQNSVDNRALQFIADRPFLFFIYNSQTKMFLFYGAVFKPTGYTDF